METVQFGIDVIYFILTRNAVTDEFSIDIHLYIYIFRSPHAHKQYRKTSSSSSNLCNVLYIQRIIWIFRLNIIQMSANDINVIKLQ